LKYQVQSHTFVLERTFWSFFQKLTFYFLLDCCFCLFNAGFRKQGLVHKSQLSNYRIEDEAMKEMFQKGEDLWVKVIRTVRTNTLTTTTLYNEKT